MSENAKFCFILYTYSLLTNENNFLIILALLFKYSIPLELLEIKHSPD